MSMKLFLILKFIEIFCAYIGMTTVLPFFVLRTRLMKQRMTEKILMSFLVGNFYLMNLVFLLQLLHISNRWTLLSGTVFPAFAVWIHLNHINLFQKIRYIWDTTHKLAVGYIGVKKVWYNIRESFTKHVKWLITYLFKAVLRRPVDWLLVLGIFGVVIWFYGIGKLDVFGYTASDTPVHLNWINGMEQNNIFIDGVYPFGYHCIIYYLHAVFQIDSYILMCLFSLVQTIAIHLVLLAFLRLCCKSRYVSYAMVLLYTIGNFLQDSTYLRFFSVLPQEYGMLFILPAAYFAFRFFAARKRELDGKKTRLSSAWSLTFFAMSFGMTLAVHFYDTMIAGLFCVGIAIGYLFWFVRGKYFWRVIMACFLGVFSAVLPMGIAFVSGTPLQGSLGWGMSVIQGDGGQEETSGGAVQKLSGNATVYYYDSEGNLLEESTVDTKEAIEKTKKLEVPLSQKLARVWMKLSTTIRDVVLNEPLAWYPLVVIGAIGLLFVFGFLFFLLRKRQYGAMLFSMGWFMVLLWILQTAKELGIPELMDANRCRIYFAYMLPVVFCLVLDAGIRLTIYPKKWWVIRDVVSFACVGAMVLFLWDGNYRKPLVDNTPLVTNEAIACMTSIIKQEKDHTWTIVSANDETQMGLFHGYHYELISFLREMEYTNGQSGREHNIKIPTDKVYVFVEKVPLDYTEQYDGSGQKISPKGAEKELPNVGGIEMYMGEYRWIVMSRLYYWAKEFARLYPTNVSIYCETDDFICYKIIQNPYRLFNFAIDYGYNSRKTGGE
ncbi:MAG: hypothetical protein ACI4SQ_02315 [Eubacterium sp.]